MTKIATGVPPSGADSDQVTGTDGKQKHGLFTYHLLKALNDYKGKATIQELYDALTPRVQDAARRDNRSQTPQLMGAQARPMSLHK